MNWVNYQHEQYTAYLSEKEAQARHEHLVQAAREASRHAESAGVLERLTHWITGDAN